MKNTIPYKGYTPVPHIIIEDMYQDKKHSDTFIRTYLALIRIVLGYDDKRAKLSVDKKYTELAAMVNASPRSVKRAIRKLKAEGKIVVKRAKGQGKPNNYTLIWPGMPDNQPPNNGHEPDY